MAYEASFTPPDPADLTGDLYIGDSGSRLYVCAVSAKTVYEYPLSTAWDVGSAGSLSASFVAASGGDVSVLGFTFHASGTKLYAFGHTTDTVYQHPLSTPWDLSTAGASEASHTFTIGTNAGVQFKSDGTRIFTLATSRTVEQYDLSGAWDVSTVGASQGTFTASSGDFDATNTRSLWFGNSGQYMYIAGDKGASDKVVMYELSTAWDVTTATKVSTLYVNNEETFVEAVALSNDGTRAYISGSANDTVYQYILSPAWQIDSADGVQHQPELAWLHDPDRDPINTYPRIGRGTADPYSTAWPNLMRRPNKGTGMVIVSLSQSQQPGNQHEHTVKWLWGNLDDPLSTYPRMGIGINDPMSHRWDGGVNRPFRMALEGAAGLTGPVIGSRIFNSPIFQSRAFSSAG